MELENLKKQKEVYISKIFWLALQIALIFAVPAVLGALIGKKLQDAYGLGQNFTLFVLIGTFVFSWLVVIIMYNHLSKKIKKVEKEIAEKK